MTTAVERQKKLINLMLDMIAQFVTNYRGKDRAYVADFVRLLKRTPFLDLKGQQDFLNRCEEYISKYYSPSPHHTVPKFRSFSNLETKDYMTTPFLWFSVAFTGKCTELIRANDSGTYFLRLVSGLLRDPTGDNGILPLLEQGVSLTDLKWEDLQYQVHDPKYQPRLTAEELQIVHWIYGSLPDLQITHLSRPYLQELMCAQGFPAITVDQLDTLAKKAKFAFWVNPNFLRLNLWLGFLTLEIPSTLSLTDVIDFANPVNSVLRWSRIRKEYLTPPDTRETQKFLGMIYLPLGHETAFLRLLREKQSQNEIHTFQLEPIEEISHVFSLSTYHQGEGFEQYKPQDYWRPLKAIFETPKEDDGDLNFNEGTSQMDTFVSRYLPGPAEPLTPALAGILKKTWGDLSLVDTMVKYDPLEQILVERLQQEEVLVLGFLMENISDQLGLSTFSHLRLPHIPWSLLMALLRYSPNARVYHTPKTYHIISRWQDSLVQFLEPLLPWHKEISLTNIITAQRGKPDSRDLDSIEGVWRTPLILRDYL